MLYVQSIHQASRDSSFNNIPNQFEEQMARRSFVTRVYSLLFGMLVLTGVQLLIGLMLEVVLHFFLEHTFIVFIATFVYMIVIFALVCCPNVRHKSPLNYIMLFLLVESLSVICIYATAYYRTEIIAISFGLTAAICIFVSIIAIVAPCDLTRCTLFLTILGVCVFIVGIAATLVAVFARNYVLQTVYAGLCVCLFSLYLAYDTQLIFGGRHQELGPDDVVYGAMTLYLDIILIFIYMAQLLYECL